MLFDLRGRGRRRVVKFIYFGLAVLMGGGLVLFGVGGATSGGLLDAFKNDSGSTSTSDVFKKRVDSAQKGVTVRPTDPRAWAELTKVRFQQAISGDGYDQAQGVFTDKGKDELRQTEAAWNKYLTLTKKPDPNVANIMIQAFGQAGLNEPDKAVTAMESYLAEREPTAQLYVQYASLAYAAGQSRKGDLASKKAISLSPKDDKEQIKGQLESAKSQAAAAASSSTPSTTTTPAG